MKASPNALRTQPRVGTTRGSTMVVRLDLVEAELIALGVLHDDVPGAERRRGLVTLHPRGAEGHQLGTPRLKCGHALLTLQARGRPDVEVHAVLRRGSSSMGLALGHLLEEQ